MRKSMGIMAVLMGALLVSAPVFAGNGEQNQHQHRYHDPQVVVGPVGPVGPMGPGGLDGEPGVDGVDGKDGVDGVDGKDGVSYVFPAVDFEDRIQMGDAVAASIPDAFLERDRKYGVFVGTGFAMNHTGLGVAGAVRLSDTAILSGGFATNLRASDSAGGRDYQVGEYITGKVQVGWTF